MFSSPLILSALNHCYTCISIWQKPKTEGKGSQYFDFLSSTMTAFIVKLLLIIATPIIVMLMNSAHAYQCTSITPCMPLSMDTEVYTIIKEDIQGHRWYHKWATHNMINLDSFPSGKWLSDFFFMYHIWWDEISNHITWQVK